MKVGSVLFIGLIVLILSVGVTVADRLPNETPENQIFTIDTVVDATGAIDASSDMAWVITSPGSIETGILADHSNFVDGVAYWYPKGKVIADSVFKDTLLTNGGKLGMNKNFDFNSKNKALSLYNIEAEKVLTYSSTEGAHMVGEEEFTLSVAGEAKKETDNIRCVFSTPRNGWLPPFCNTVSAKSAMVNINSAQVSTKGQMRSVAKTDDIPAELNYQIAVTPDANSGSGFAEGTVKTTYAGSIMEGRGSGAYFTKGFNTPWGKNKGDDVPWDILHEYHIIGFSSDDIAFRTSAENSWKDSSEVTGGIKNFQKAFAYQSGFKL